jgi:hypothetical protein
MAGSPVDPAIDLINRAYDAVLASDDAALRSTMTLGVQWLAGAGPLGGAQNLNGIWQVADYLYWPHRVRDYGALTITSRAIGIRQGTNIYPASHVFVTATQRIKVRLTIRVQPDPLLIDFVTQTF